MLKAQRLHLLAFLCALLCLPTPAHALAQLSISPVTDSVFVLSGNSLDGVSGLQVSIAYDGAILSNPRVEVGDRLSGMMTAINPANPIKVAIVGSRSLSGSGALATISFDRSNVPAGGITSLTATAIDLQGQSVPLAQPVVTNPTHSDAPDHGGGTPPEGTTTPRPVTTGGSVALPGSQPESPAEKKEHPAQTAQQDKKEEPQPPAPDSEPVPPRSDAADEEAAAPKSDAAPMPPERFETVLERFRIFDGEKTTEDYLSFFSNLSAGRFTQSPKVALADGISKVTLAITKVPEAPRFTFQGAKFTSFSQTGPGEWNIEVIPEKGVVRASVTVLMKGSQQDFPLTVAPKAELPLTNPAQPTPADFLRFLKERGTATAPKFDLNGDGRRDYVDDYIFTANYIARTEEKGKQQAPQQKTQ